MTLRLTFGIDPGLTGAVATLIDGEPGPMLDMPCVDGDGRREIDAEKLAAWIRIMRTNHPGAVFTAALERVKGRGGWHSTANFNFGDGYGHVRAVLKVLGIPISYADPQAWKRYYRIGSDKEAARKLALSRFPSAEHDLRRKKDEARAEALLIALWHENHAMQGARAA